MSLSNGTRDIPRAAPAATDPQTCTGKAPATAAPLDELRALLLGDHVSELDIARTRIAQLEHLLSERESIIARTSDALPEAIRRHAGSDTELQHALLPDIEHAVHRSVRDRPERMAEAIYPIMGPVIRKIIEKLFERSRDTGEQPWNIEQLFLMHRRSGLLLAHAGADDVVSADADMVSGMLSAVRSYVQEAFGSDDFDGLRVMNVGDVNIRVEWGPDAVLAAVVRGIEPAQLQPALQGLLAEVHRTHADALTNYAGDESAFADVPLQLHKVLAETSSEAEAPFWKRHLLSIVLVTIATVIGASLLSARNVARWQNMLQVLNEEPGLVVLSGDRDSRQIRLLRDPRAVDPGPLLARAFGLDENDVQFINYSYDAGFHAREPDGASSGDPISASETQTNP